MNKGWLSKALGHIQNGTIFWRIKNHSKIEHERRWIKFTDSNASYIDVKLSEFTIRLYKGDLITRAIYFNDFESTEIKFLQEHIKEGDVFFDIGGNIGLFTLLAASKVKKAGVVYTFEPSDENFKKLKENLLLNQFTNVKPYLLAVSHKKEKKNLYNFSEGLGALSSFALIENEKYSVSEVQTVTLSDFVEEEAVSQDIAIMKIDVEGWELPVLLGARTILEKENAPFLIVEFTDANARNAGYTCQQVFDLLVEYGYSMYSITSDLMLRPEVKKYYYDYTNLIAIKKGSAGYTRLKHLICAL